MIKYWKISVLKKIMFISTAIATNKTKRLLYKNKQKWN